MPGYGISEADEGMLPWSWAQVRLEQSHDYWVASVRPDGRPHVMPVWGAFYDGCLWFSSDLGSRKARNLKTEPRCVVTTDDPLEPVVVEGVAEVVYDRAVTSAYVDAIRIKYADEWVAESFTVDFFDANLGGGGTYKVTLNSVFALKESEFSTSPTKWVF
jgi:hypothetical protein